MQYQHVTKSHWSDNVYYNEIERDLHIWCWGIPTSNDGKRSSKDMKANLGLVGGCCTHGTLKADMLYHWIDMFIDGPPNERIPVLLVLASDPRVHPLDELQELFDSHSHPNKAIKRSSSILERGHYFLYTQGMGRTRQQTTRLTPFWPDLITMPINQSAAKDKSRSEKTRRETLLRDQGCMMTGEGFPWTQNGPNAIGCHVAHIWALYTVGKSGYVDIVPDDSPIKLLIMSRKAVDQPCNTLTMRADIHAQFDDYQCSLWYHESTDEYEIIKFEKSGAHMLESGSIILLRPKSNIGIEVDTVNPAFFKEQTRLCVLQNVCGEGKVDKPHSSLLRRPDST